MNILLTGANGGIGSVIEKQLRAAGNTVIGVTSADADLEDFSAIEKLKERVLSQAGHIDWIVCAHGFIDSETVLENMTVENIEKTFRVNTLSIIYLAQQFLPTIPAGGGILSISSAAGVRANGRFAPYSASKAAVNGFMQAMARNRPQQIFFALCPGPTNTGMRQRVAVDPAAQGPEAVASVISEMVAGRGNYTSGDIVVVRDGKVETVSRIG